MMDIDKTEGRLVDELGEMCQRTARGELTRC